MKHYVSLLRGVNVGGRNIKMIDLVNCYQRLGLLDVKSILQSGNVIFSCEEASASVLKSKIEKAVSKRFGYSAKVFVLDLEKLKVILNNYPFDSDNDTYQHYIIFTDGIITTRLYDEGKLIKSDSDGVSLYNSVIYWKVEKGKSVESPFSKLLVKKEFKQFHTNRNIRTIAKLC
ncbi:MAG TPA: DUF1697 domain-containing protein [Candidatus Saccharimonadia bacterium]|nr:DUF1697 domain-containing protein [Candidatus Saccharimonadia bacterium]